MPDEATQSSNDPVNQLAHTTTPAKNPQRVIRTFASDMARASHPSEPSEPASAPLPPPPKPPPPPAVPKPPPPMPMPARFGPNEAPIQPLASIPTYSPAPRVESAPIKPPPPPPEPLPPPPPLDVPQPSIRSEWTAGEQGVVRDETPSFFARLLGHKHESKAPVPAPEPPTPQPAVPAYVSTTPPTPTISVPEPTQDREAVLARLRARVADNVSGGAQPIPQAPVFPTPSPVPEPTLPQAVPVPENLPGVPTAAPELPQAWESDARGRVEASDVSAFAALAAEADAPRPEAVHRLSHEASNRGLMYALIATVLVVGGSTLIYFAYTYFVSTAPVSVVSSAPKTILVGDDQTTISGSGSTLMSALAGAANTSIPSGNVRVIYLSVASTTRSGTNVTLTYPGGDLIMALRLNAPDILLRNIAEDSTVGIVNVNGETHPFFVLDSEDYQRTFAGMLAWESTIGTDLAPLYPDSFTQTQSQSTQTTTASTSTQSSGKGKGKNKNSTSITASSTTTTDTNTINANTPVYLSTPYFVDEVVESHDVRALKDPSGSTILVYGYKDQNTLIIARDETAFTVLLSRLTATRTE